MIKIILNNIKFKKKMYYIQDKFKKVEQVIKQVKKIIQLYLNKKYFIIK